MVDEQVQRSSLTVHAVQDTQLAEPTPSGMYHPGKL